MTLAVQQLVKYKKERKKEYMALVAKFYSLFIAVSFAQNLIMVHLSSISDLL